MRGAVAVVAAFVTLFALSNAHQDGCGHCQRFRQQFIHSPSRWRVWDNPTVRHLVSLPNIPLGYASEQASRLWDYLDAQTTGKLSHDNDGREDVDELNSNGVEGPSRRGCNLGGDDIDYPHGPDGLDYPDCQYRQHVNRDEPGTTERAAEESHTPNDAPTRHGVNLRQISNVWKQWMENMNDAQWDANLPYLTQILSNMWESGDEKASAEGAPENSEDAETKQDVEPTENELDEEQYYNDLIRKKQEMERKLTQDREQVRQLEENIKNERNLMRTREEQRQRKLEIQAMRRQEEERRRTEKGRLERVRLETEQKEMERQMQQEQQRLKQLQEEQDMLRKQRLAEEKAANHQRQHRGNKADQHNRHQSAQHEDTPHRQFRNQHNFHKQQQQQQQQQQRHNHHQHQQQRSELFSLQIPGEYTPRDIKVKTSGDDIRVVGKRVCDCDENCVVKEFVRGFKLPQGVPTASLQATFHAGGYLSIEGATNHREPRVVDTEVPVVPQGVFEDVSSIRDRLDCLKKKSGFKMSKMDKKTGKAYEAEEFRQSQESYDYVGSSMFDHEDDGVTIEDVDE